MDTAPDLSAIQDSELEAKGMELEVLKETVEQLKLVTTSKSNNGGGDNGENEDGWDCEDVCECTSKFDPDF